MTTLQSHSLTAIITATIAVAVTYAILTNGDTQPPPIDPETYRTEERLRMRDSIVRPELVKDSFDVVVTRIADRPKQRQKTEDLWTMRKLERWPVSDSVLGVELIERIENWKQ